MKSDLKAVEKGRDSFKRHFEVYTHLLVLVLYLVETRNR